MRPGASWGKHKRLMMPGNLPHSDEAFDDRLDIDIFDPPREDWLDGSDSYLRGPGSGE